MLKSWPIECDCKNDRYDSTVEIQSFFYVTQISNESWTQAIQAVEELKNTIDPTLSKNQIGKVEPSLTVSYVQLEKTVEYKDQKNKVSARRYSRGALPAPWRERVGESDKDRL